jgi:low affinity Fe/Cu permease
MLRGGRGRCGRGSRRDDHSTAIIRGISNVTGWLGSFPAILLSLAVVVVWGIGGFFVAGRFANDTYQLLINTPTTVVTFLMVFIIQNTQNRDGRAIQTKLDARTEALRAIGERLGVDEDCTPRLMELVGLEDAPEEDIKRRQDEVRDAAATA